MDVNITWDDVPWLDYRKQISEGITDGEPVGWVVTHERALLQLATADGPVRAELSGRFRHLADLGAAELPAVGDFVAYRPGEPAQIDRVLPRKSAFRRKEAGVRTEAQVLCANADLAIIVTTAPGMDADDPGHELDDFSLRRIERYTATLDPRIRSLVILNKCDLVADPQAVRAYVAAELPGTIVVALSALTGDGVDALEGILEPGNVAVMVGSSGCGKSTLINRLAGAEAKTGHIRYTDGRGRHTTTTRSMYRLPNGGIVVDTPGMREVQVWAEDETGGDPVAQAFPEIAELEDLCKFSDCRHEHEPGCAVKEQLAEGSILPDRYRSYLQLRNAVGLTSEMRRQKARERGRQIAKFSRQLKKDRNR